MMSSDEGNSFLSGVVFQMCRRYEVKMSETNRMNSLPVFPSSDQFLCLSEATSDFICW